MTTDGQLLSTLEGGRSRFTLALCSALGGSAVVLVTLVAMNALEMRKQAEPEKTVSSFEVKRRTPPPAAKPKPKPKPKKKNRRQATPLPNLGPSLSGASFGLPGLSDALSDATDSLLGDVSDTVMTEDTVDELPKPTSRVPAPYPARARAKGIEGFVEVTMLIDTDGGVKDLQVLEAQPPGVFEDAALAALRNWTFRPAQYEGRSVAIRVRQTYRFSLE